MEYQISNLEGNLQCASSMTLFFLLCAWAVFEGAQTATSDFYTFAVSASQTCSGEASYTWWHSQTCLWCDTISSLSPRHYDLLLYSCAQFLCSNVAYFSILKPCYCWSHCVLNSWVLVDMFCHVSSILLFVHMLSSCLEVAPYRFLQANIPQLIFSDSNSVQWIMLLLEIFLHF